MNLPQRWTSPLSLLEDLENFGLPMTVSGAQQGLSIYETDNEIFVEAALPGLDEKDIEVTFERGTLMVRGKKEETEEDKKRRYFHKANRSFVYRLTVPGNLDEMQEPRAEFKDGIAKIIFKKKKKEEPRRIPVQRK
jgi:HSP20 family protein